MAKMKSFGHKSWGQYLAIVFMITTAALVLARDSERKGAADAFGGLPAKIASKSGHFQVMKAGQRWVFATPEGNAFWMLGVYGVNWNDGGPVGREMFQSKYGGKPAKFAEHALQRLAAWGFNTVDLYSVPFTLPIEFHGRPANPQKMPFLRCPNFSWYGAIGARGMTPFKTLLAGAVDPAVYHGYWGHVPDVFDPNFAADVKATLTSRDTEISQLGDQPWLLAILPDDTDYLMGFGPGPEIPGVDGVIHPHIGWIVAVTRPTQSENDQVGKAFRKNPLDVTYSDPTVYAKKAWRDFLKNKYGTIEALNKAWGAKYTTFDSDGGWPMGRGLMDESGRNPWIGNDALKLSGASSGARTDMDAFLEVYADKYFQTTSEVIHAVMPHLLIFSPAVLDSHHGLTRPQILRAAGRYSDVLVVSNPEDLRVLSRTYDEAHRPMVSWTGIPANADSDLHDFPPKQGFKAISSQAERGQEYRQRLQALYNFRASDGSYPMVGISWWEYLGKFGEKANWGLVSMRDNAYDGREAVRAPGKDPWGYPTGGEDKDYGDFISEVTRTNKDILSRLTDELASPKGAATHSGSESH